MSSKRGTLLDIPEEPIHTRGKGIRILHTKKIPILDDAGRPRSAGISEDITERKRSRRKSSGSASANIDGLAGAARRIGQQLAGIAFLAEALAGS